MDPRQNGGRDLSRAERFEEEKRRIVESCFNKKDVDGSLLETYITHIRITEFSSHPSGPPPPEARNTQAEKPRVIIVAVRKSGRVRMHKSKENANGTFSIGKTWDLNDLTAVESFTSSSTDPQKREWALDTGFIVNIGKPYFWQAQADKEKKFFIASLIKIYGKYTGGKIPELIGFDPRELDQVLGARKSAVPRPPIPIPPEPRVEEAPSFENPPSVYAGLAAANRSTGNLSIGSDMGGAPPPPRPPPSPGRTLIPPSTASPVPSVESARSANPAAQLRKVASNNKSQDSVAASFATAKSEEGGNLRPRSRSNTPGAGPAGRFGEPPPDPPFPPQMDLPDRRRPPMDPMRPAGPPDQDLVPAPLMSPGNRREPREPPPRSIDRMSPRKDSLSRRSEPGSLQEQPTPPPEQPAVEPPVEVKTGTNGTPTPTVDSASTPETPVTPTPESPDDARPGLGPMIKSKRSQRDLAGTLWKAASAVNAFKPRPGGAGEKLRGAMSKASSGPDGMTEVVPAPPRKVETPKPIETPPKAATPDSKPSENGAHAVPEVKVTVPSSSRPTSLQAATQEAKRRSAELTSKDDKLKPVMASNDAKYFSTLGIDTSLLGGQTADFASWLDHFGWVPGDKMRSRNFEEMKLDIDRQLNKVQAGGWVVRFEEEDERIDAIKKGLDVAIAECDELDNLLTLYSVELSTLADDIAYIEAQGQGLQVQASNQKLLRKELESLLDTCAITSDDLGPLSRANIETFPGLEDIEQTLVILYKAMMKIDPTMAGTQSGTSTEAGLGENQAGFNTDYGKMRIVQEKKEMYVQESAEFLQRLQNFMTGQFDESISATKKALEGALSRKVDAKHHEVGRALLWRYTGLMLYAREVELTQWDLLVQTYQRKNFPLYKSEFREVLDAWKRNARKPTGEENELLFTAQVEKQQETTLATARKLTVKRSQTLARSLRSPLGDGSSKTNVDKISDARSLPYEVFTGIMDDLLPLVEMEQNFIIDFFHATTLETLDFPDIVHASKPRDRQGSDLRRHRLMEPDRELARQVTKAMEVIFAFLEQDLQNSVDWVLSQDPLQGVGVLATLERKQTEISQSNQDFLNNILQKLHQNLETRFTRFVDEQIRAIEETKVKIKKRKGVISFMRVFPQFSAAVENMVGNADVNSSARRTLDREYDRIVKSMFDALKVIARENPATLTNTGADPEDKEALNYHILLIENMNHFQEEVDTHGLEVLEDWKEAASSELAEHMDLYLGAVMRRPLGKLLEYLENIEAQLATGKSPTNIAAQPSNSKSTFNRVLSAYDSKEVRKGVEVLRKRVEKHFGDPEDAGAGKTLVNRVLKECEKFYSDVEVRISTVTTTVYGGDVLFEWPRAEVKGAFSLSGR